jgi:radical SAM superfamily enzyme YgiQ (UPF0313 family)
MSITTVARHAGLDVSICDLNLARYRNELLAGEMPYGLAAEYLLSFKPDLLGFGTICSTLPGAVMVCQALNKKGAKPVIVFGGPQATIVHEQLLVKVPEIDYVLCGEADYSFTELIKSFGSPSQGQVPGLAQRIDGRIAFTPLQHSVDVNTLPLINYDTWPLREAMQKGWFSKGIPIDAGRGCPYRCAFCSTSRFFSRSFRMKNPERIQQEALILHQKYGCKAFNLTHDSFTSGRSNAMAIAKAMAMTGIPELSWVCSARVDTLDRELIGTLKQSGCSRIYFGIETASPRMQRSINKHLNLGKAEPTLKYALEMGLGFTVSCIIGFPDETRSDLEMTLRFLLRWSGIDGVNTQIHLLAPQSGTAIMEKFGKRIQHDAWFPDAAYFNKRQSSSELRFVKENPEICPQGYYFPNAQIRRNELLAIREYVKLLLGVLPGMGPYLLRIGKPIVDLILEWQRCCTARGLRQPDETGFFGYMGLERMEYVQVLLDELARNGGLAAHRSCLIDFWQTVLEAMTKANADSHAELKPIPTSFKELKRYLNDTPLFSAPCVLKTFDFDVNGCLQRWSKTGQWRWPEKRRAAYLLVQKEDELMVNELSPGLEALCGMVSDENSLGSIFASVRQSHMFAGTIDQFGYGKTLEQIVTVLSKMVRIHLKSNSP